MSSTLGFSENVVTTEPFSDASDAVPINIFKGDVLDLKYLNKRYPTAR